MGFSTPSYPLNDRDQMGSDGIRPDWIEPDQTGSDWIGPDQMGLDRTESDQMG